MSIAHTPLETSTLSADAQRALSPGPAKMMAARGLAPLANPADLLSVLYQLGLDADDRVRSAARQTASTLPEKILTGGLTDDKLDVRVIDYFVRSLDGRDELLQVAILNRAAGDATIAWLAGRATSKICDLIAQNEERVLRHPDIIAALYTNRQARMSTVDRVVELAVRNQVKVTAIPAWDELCRALLQSGKDQEPTPDAELMDALFASAVPPDRTGQEEVSGEEPPPEQQIKLRDMTVPMKIRLATLGNSFDRSILVRDPKKIVALAAIKSPMLTESEAAKFAGNNSICEEVIGYIASRRDWTKQYNVKLALVQNPKCPLPAAMRLVPHLREKDIRTIARSKGIPSALSAQARKLTMERSKGGKS